MNKKIKICVLVIVLFLIPTCSFAEDDPYGTINKFSKTLLNALSWCGYAIALGALIFLGIKYVMSGAQQKADLKNRFALYLVGIALIVMCSAIAGIVADIANKDGSNTAEGIIAVGDTVGNAIIEGTQGDVGFDFDSGMPDEFVKHKNEALEEGWTVKSYKNSNVIFHVPEGIKYDYDDLPGSDPSIEVSYNQGFFGWYVKETKLDDYTTIYYEFENEKFVFSGSDSFLGNGATSKYEIWVDIVD